MRSATPPKKCFSKRKPLLVDIFYKDIWLEVGENMLNFFSQIGCYEGSWYGFRLRKCVFRYQSQCESGSVQYDHHAAIGCWVTPDDTYEAGPKENGGNIAELSKNMLTTSNYTCIIHICTSNIFLAWQVCILSLLTHPKLGPLTASVNNFTTWLKVYTKLYWKAYALDICSIFENLRCEMWNMNFLNMIYVYTLCPQYMLSCFSTFCLAVMNFGNLIIDSPWPASFWEARDSHGMSLRNFRNSFLLGVGCIWNSPRLKMRIILLRCWEIVNQNSLSMFLKKSLHPRS